METARLVLREETLELLEQVEQFPVDEQLEFFGASDEMELAILWDKVRKRRSNSAIGFRKWHLIEKESQRVIGACGYHNWFTEHERAELGYHLHPDFRKKGYLSEALQPIIAHGFEVMKLNRIEAFISPDNKPSQQAVLRAGFTLEGVLREHYKQGDQLFDSQVYSRLKSDRR